LKRYEDNFRRESQEKAGILKRLETANQESERLRREICHLENELLGLPNNQYVHV
jgi:hypothetical protein